MHAKRPLHHTLTQRRPQGRPTRGKTAHNRLRRVDIFCMRYDPALLQREDDAFAGSCVVDLGYGAEPFTTLEMAARLRRLNPELAVIGVEIDTERVRNALPFADDLTDFRLGGFNLPLALGAGGKREAVRLIRALNVLRQYDEDEVTTAYAQLAQYVVGGGLLVEGTSDPYGRLWVANVLRRHPVQARWVPEALVFSTNFRSGFDPMDFPPVLPKNYIHRMLPDQPIHTFFEQWQQAAHRALPERIWGVRRWFYAAALQLAESGVAIDQRPWWIKHGYLVVRMPLAGAAG